MDVMERQWAGARWRGSVVVPVPLVWVLLVVALAVAAGWVGPTTLQVCATLEDFPCGP